MTILKVNPDGTTIPLASGATVVPPVNLRLVPNPKALSLKVTAQEFSAAGAVPGSSLGTVANVINLGTVVVPPANLGVTRLSLYNTDTQISIRSIDATDTINLDTQPQPFSVRAVVDNLTGVGSVVLTLDGHKNPENTEPYSLQGDRTPWVPSVGTHTITAQAYAGTLGTGATVGPEFKSSISVTKTVVPPPPVPPPVPPPTGTVLPPPAPGSWELIFHDDFDTDVWARKNAAGVPVYSENIFGAPESIDEHYDRTHATVAGGVLTLRATRQAAGGHPYTSGCIATGGMNFDDANPGFLCNPGSYIEARMKLPVGKGLWPAFWMMSMKGGEEIDIMECINDAPGQWYGTLHYSGTSGHRIPTGTNLADWHTYAVDWSAGYIAWYFDGKEVARTTSSTPPSPHYWMINLQMNDGQWGAAADASTPLPADMLVDWVRVWRRK